MVKLNLPKVASRVRFSLPASHHRFGGDFFACYSAGAWYNKGIPVPGVVVTANVISDPSLVKGGALPLRRRVRDQQLNRSLSGMIHSIRVVPREISSLVSMGLLGAFLLFRRNLG